MSEPRKRRELTRRSASSLRKSTYVTETPQKQDEVATTHGRSANSIVHVVAERLSHRTKDADPRQMRATRKTNISAVRYLGIDALDSGVSTYAGIQPNASHINCEVLDPIQSRAQDLSAQRLLESLEIRQQSRVRSPGLSLTPTHDNTSTSVVPASSNICVATFRRCLCQCVAAPSISPALSSFSRRR